MPDTPQPWDMQPGETLEGYSRFLAYRNIGPSRTLVQAEQVHGGTAKRKKTPSGHWTDESAAFRWRERATQWDIFHLREVAPELVTAWLAALMTIARKTLEKLTSQTCKPKTFRDCVAVIGVLSQYLTPEVIQAVTARQRQTELAADECTLDRLRPSPEDAP